MYLRRMKSGTPVILAICILPIPFKKKRPLRAVYGNIDGTEVRKEFPLEQHFEIDGYEVYMIHIGGYPKRYAKGIKEKLK